MYQIIHKNGGGLAYYGKAHPYHTPITSLKHTQLLFVWKSFPTSSNN